MADAANKIIEQFKHLPLDGGLQPSKTNKTKEAAKKKPAKAHAAEAKAKQ